jgi:hypothetical protein
MCIEGFCIGHRFESPEFVKIADGFCADESGNMLNRYFADTFDDDECRAQCKDDPACLAYSFGFHFCSIYGGIRGAHPSVTWWGYIWKLGTLWGDVGATDFGDNVLEQAATVVAPLANQQVVACWKKVDRAPVENTDLPISHEIAFGILLFMLFSTPAVWLILWKLRQHPEEDIRSDDGSWHEDETAIESLTLFEAQDGLAFAARQFTDKENPVQSPRGSNPSAVAMAPPMIEEGADNEVCPPLGEEDAPVNGDSGSDGIRSTDPRGEVEDDMPTGAK